MGYEVSVIICSIFKTVCPVKREKTSYENLNMITISVLRSLLLVIGLTLLAGCSGGSNPDSTSSLSANNVNLIFVVSPDLTHQAAGDVDPNTANLTNQGLQRSLLMATYLKQQVLGAHNVTAIYALSPMTHLQTANNYPDMSPLVTIQQFAMLNQFSMQSAGLGSTSYAANSFPVNVSYSIGSPFGVQSPVFTCANCQGLDFSNTGGNNDLLAADIISKAIPGFYVFSAPWATISAMLTKINSANGYNLNLPTTYMGPNYVYAISIPSSGSASLVTYNSNLNPTTTYPVLQSPPLLNVPCTAQASSQTPFTITSAGGTIPTGISKSQTIYMVRHAEAHPTNTWDDGNFLAAGQWRALDLPTALRGKISPDMVYSVDPAQVYPGSAVTAGNPDVSYVRTSLTVAPYAIANNLPYYLVSNIEIFNPFPNVATPPPYPAEIVSTNDFFFKNNTFSNKTVLMAWEHSHFTPLMAELFSRYFPGGGGPTVPDWPADDYDSIWTVTLDAAGNLTLSNSLCEGINSATLPATAPLF